VNRISEAKSDASRIPRLFAALKGAKRLKLQIETPVEKASVVRGMERSFSSF